MRFIHIIYSLSPLLRVICSYIIIVAVVVVVVVVVVVAAAAAGF